MESATEWRNEFDILYNSINSEVAPALDDYELSVLLTTAQEQVVRQIYSGTYEGFESTEEARRALDVLVQQKVNTIAKKDITKSADGFYYSPNISNGDSVMCITSEYIIYSDETCDLEKELLVVPITQDTFYKMKKNPFKMPNTRKALRLDVGEDQCKIVTSFNNQYNYYVNYIKKPYPIILYDNGLETINGYNLPYSQTKVCELDSTLHRTILTTAVTLATSIYNK